MANYRVVAIGSMSTFPVINLKSLSLTAFGPFFHINDSLF